MLTILSYFSFLFGALVLALVLLIGSNKAQLV